MATNVWIEEFCIARIPYNSPSDSVGDSGRPLAKEQDSIRGNTTKRKGERGLSSNVKSNIHHKHADKVKPG